MLPLASLRLVCVEQYGAAPWGTMHLADLGAEVIKIERPDEPDVSRSIGPFHLGNGDSQFFHSFNRNKRSMTLDLKQEEGKRVLHDLVRCSDGVINNLRGDVPAKLGLDYRALGEINERIACVHLSAYGRKGARTAWPGYDYLMQAEAGYLSLTGEPDGPPSRFGLSMVDQMTGITAALAMLAGVLEARASGRGRDLDVNLFDTALANLSYLATWRLNAGHLQGREARSSHPSLTPSQLYRTKDGWIFVMCNKEKFWPLLARALGRDEWIEEPDFRDFPARLENRARLTELLDQEFMRRTTGDWLDCLSGIVPVAPVNDVAAALENPLVTGEDRLTEVETADGTRLSMVRGPIHCDGESAPGHAGPAYGADTQHILAETLGYDEKRIQELVRAGAI